MASSPASITLYIPIIASGRHRKADAELCGLFKTEIEAQHALIDRLVYRGLISFDMYCDGKDEDEPEVEDEEAFCAMLKTRLANGAHLGSICEEMGDSYYGEGWTWQIDTRVLIL
jgi:hypothetical protein